MDKVDQRLKCLEIAATRTVDVNDTMARAEAFYNWVNKPEVESNKPQMDQKRLDPSKTTDTPKILL